MRKLTALTQLIGYWLLGWCIVGLALGGFSILSLGYIGGFIERRLYEVVDVLIISNIPSIELSALGRWLLVPIVGILLFITRSYLPRVYRKAAQLAVTGGFICWILVALVFNNPYREEWK